MNVKLAAFVTSNLCDDELQYIVQQMPNFTILVNNYPTIKYIFSTHILALEGLNTALRKHAI